MASLLPASQNKRRALFHRLGYGLVAIAVLLAVAARALGIDVDAPATVLVFAAAVLAVLQFGALDETARQGQYVSWYWGGMAGVALLGLVSIGLSFDVIPFAPIQAWIESWHERADNEVVFLMGLMTGPLVMTVGFFVWWAIYWLRMR